MCTVLPIILLESPISVIFTLCPLLLIVLVVGIAVVPEG